MAQIPDDLAAANAKLIEEFRERGRRRKVLLAERPGVRLRQREWEILELLAEGLSTAEIAAA